MSESFTVVISACSVCNGSTIMMKHYRVFCFLSSNC